MNARDILAQQDMEYFQALSIDIANEEKARKHIEDALRREAQEADDEIEDALQTPPLTLEEMRAARVRALSTVSAPQKKRKRRRLTCEVDPNNIINYKRRTRK